MMTEPDSEEPTSENLRLFRGKVRFNSFDRDLNDVITKVKSGRMTPDEAEGRRSTATPARASPVR
jgi:hypothetical protein